MFDGLFTGCSCCTKLREIVKTFNDELLSQRDFHRGLCVWATETKTEVNVEVFWLEVCCQECKNTGYVLTADGEIFKRRLTPWMTNSEDEKPKPF